MITTRPYTNSIYQTSITDYYNGVLKLGDGESYGTGNLLYDGRSLLTAAHVFDGRNYDRLKIYLYDGVNNFTAYASIKHDIYYDDYDLNNDTEKLVGNTIYKPKRITPEASLKFGFRF